MLTMRIEGELGSSWLSREMIYDGEMLPVSIGEQAFSARLVRYDYQLPHRPRFGRSYVVDGATISAEFYLMPAGQMAPRLPREAKPTTCPKCKQIQDSDAGIGCECAKKSMATVSAEFHQKALADERRKLAALKKINESQNEALKTECARTKAQADAMAAMLAELGKLRADLAKFNAPPPDGATRWSQLEP